MGKTGESGKRWKTGFTGVYERFTPKRVDKDGNPDKCWDITYKINGKFHFEKVGWASEGFKIEDAIELRNRRIRQNRHPELSSFLEEDENITVDEAWKIFKDEYLNTIKSHKSVKYLFEKHIISEFGKRNIKSITSLDIEAFKNKLLINLRPGSINIILTYFKSVIKKACMAKNINLPDFLNSIIIRKVASKREKYLTHREAELIFDGLQFVSCDIYKMAKIAINTGLRLNEILNLRGKDINTESKTINIYDGKTGNRIAYIPEKFFPELIKMIPHDKNRYLFVNKFDRKYSKNYISKKFHDFIEETGFNYGARNEEKIVFHTFRHTFCSWLAIAGVPIYTISKLAGHTSIETTQRYAKLSPDIQKDALKDFPSI